MSEMKERPGRPRAPEAPCPKSSTSKGTHGQSSESKKELREMDRNEKKRQSYRKNFKKNQGKIYFYWFYGGQNARNTRQGGRLGEGGLLLMTLTKKRGVNQRISEDYNLVVPPKNRNFFRVERVDIPPTQ